MLMGLGTGVRGELQPNTYLWYCAKIGVWPKPPRTHPCPLD